MEQQKVFPTACFGFDKKVVLDYIYEQDTAAKAKEAELEQHATQLEEQIAELQGSVEELSAQCEIIKAQLYSEKETAAGSRSSYEKLKSDTDQLVQVARNKDKELQIQLELNKQLQNRNSELENRVGALTQELLEAQNSGITAQELLEEAKAQATLLLERARRDAKAIRAEAAAKEADHTAEVARLKEELSRIRESVGKTLTQFEGAISKLDGEKGTKAVKPAPEPEPAPAAAAPAPKKDEHEVRFFPQDPGQPETGRVKVKIRR